MDLKKRELGSLRCERCGGTQGKTKKHGIELHHKRYGLDVTYYDLELLCWPCHKKETIWYFDTHLKN